MLDVPAPGAHDVIGDRAYAREPAEAASLGRAAAEGLIAGGVLPVIKHIPGHGRARADSHKRLPVVDATLAELEARDFAPFRALADMPMAMTAHVVYRALDRSRPATTSPLVIAETIRGAIGFDGLLISDDLSMKALKGGLGERTRAALAAGCDVALHCNGDAKEMAGVVDAAPPLAGQALARAEAALARLPRDVASFDAAEGCARFAAAFDGRWAAMSPVDQPSFDFAAAEAAAEEGEALIVDLDGYEGPLHVLLALARAQKVDLLKLSITDLADQYLAFIATAQRADFILAADYLVMAAWLAYLKSRLLLPSFAPRQAGERAPEELARELAFRLAQLDALRKAAEALPDAPDPAARRLSPRRSGSHPDHRLAPAGGRSL